MKCINPVQVALCQKAAENAGQGGFLSRFIEIGQASIPLVAALGAFVGVVLTLLVGRFKEYEELIRKRRSLQLCVAADIRSITRVIINAKIIEHCCAQYRFNDRFLAMATGPKKQDYFVLYNSIAKDMGFLDYEFAGKATAFYLSLKGSRDTAESFDFLREQRWADPPRIDAAQFRLLVAATATSVLGMLEDVFRNAFLSATIARKIDQTKPRLLPLERLGVSLKISNAYEASPPETNDSAQRYYEIFQAWIMLVALNDMIKNDEKFGGPSSVNVQRLLLKTLQNKKPYIKNTIRQNNIVSTFTSMMVIVKSDNQQQDFLAGDTVIEEAAEVWGKRLSFLNDGD